MDSKVNSLSNNDSLSCPDSDHEFRYRNTGMKVIPFIPPEVPVNLKKCLWGKTTSDVVLRSPANSVTDKSLGHEFTLYYLGSASEFKEIPVG